jgi:hypothetical protein
MKSLLLTFIEGQQVTSMASWHVGPGRMSFGRLDGTCNVDVGSRAPTLPYPTRRQVIVRAGQDGRCGG